MTLFCIACDIRDFCCMSAYVSMRECVPVPCLIQTLTWLVSQECMSKTHELLLEGLLEHGRLRSHQLFSRTSASPDYDGQAVRCAFTVVTLDAINNHVSLSETRPSFRKSILTTCGRTLHRACPSKSAEPSTIWHYLIFLRNQVGYRSHGGDETADKQSSPTRRSEMGGVVSRQTRPRFLLHLMRPSKLPKTL